MKLTDLLLEVGRPIAYYPSIAKALGSVNAALLVCQLTYWCGKEHNPKLGIHKTAAEIEAETGLSVQEIRTARKILGAKGILTEKYFRLEHMIYFQVNLDALNEAFNNWLINNQMQNQHSGNEKKTTAKVENNIGEMQKVQFDNNDTEITSQNTTTTADTAQDLLSSMRGEKKVKGPSFKKAVSTEKIAEAEAIANSLRGTVLASVLPSVIAELASDHGLEKVKVTCEWIIRQYRRNPDAVENPTGLLVDMVSNGMDKPRVIVVQEAAVEKNNETAELLRRQRVLREKIKYEDIPPEVREFTAALQKK